jgi:predicted Zn-dependent protease
MPSSFDSPSTAGQPSARPVDFRQLNQADFDVEFFGRVLKRHPDYIDVLRCQGELLSRTGRHSEAYEVDRHLVTLQPAHPVAHYNLACSLALLQQPREALNELRQALELGYHDIEHLETDTDLDALRDEPEYTRLLREFGR